MLGDRFEYRGRGRELMIGFVLALLMLGAVGRPDVPGVDLRLPREAVRELRPVRHCSRCRSSLIGFPLAYVGHYAGLRYKLSRTRWRGIRCGMAGSAWRYGAIATFLQFANASTGYLLTPVVSVNLARPRIANTRVGTQGFAFAGRAGDIYGRYLGYYFLNIAGLDGGGHCDLRGDRRHAAKASASRPTISCKLFAHPSLRTVVVLAADRLRRLSPVRPADPAAALLVAGLSVALPRDPQPRRQRPVRHRDLDPADVGLPGARTT